MLHLGRPYQLDVAYPHLTLSTARIPLPPLGTLGLDPSTMIALPPLVVAQPAGFGSLSFVMPNLPILGGLSLYAQALLVQFPSSSFQSGSA